MVKVGGNEIHVKYVKKHVNFTKSWGENFARVGGKVKISEIGGKLIENREIGREIRNLW